MQRALFPFALAIMLGTSAMCGEASPPSEGLTKEQMEQAVLAVAGKMKEEIRKNSKSQPTLCYRLLPVVDEEISVGLAVKLCSGTTDAVEAISCYEEAFLHPGNGGLGLTRGLAVELCMSNRKESSEP